MAALEKKKKFPRELPGKILSLLQSSILLERLWNCSLLMPCLQILPEINIYHSVGYMDW